jgi:uncharacterized membrane protein YqaE (UPF0057 family)
MPNPVGARQTTPPDPMRYLLAIVLPPLAVLLCGKPFQALLNVLLTLLLWLPGVIHAILVVHDHLADQRAKRIVRAIQRPT